MPIHRLPDGHGAERFRKRAKTLLRHVRAGVPDALGLVAEFHPRPPQAPRLSDAQLVVARMYGFASWPRLREHLATVERYSRSPHLVAPSQEAPQEFLRLACLVYGADHRGRTARAGLMLARRPWLRTANVFTMAATGSADALARALAADPGAAGARGGPFGWEPLLYLTYARLDTPGEYVTAARVLLDHGADPDAGFLWDGLPSPFTALTGAFGGGEGDQPPHPRGPELARLLLEAGADPNDAQALYNLGLGGSFSDDTAHLGLLLEFGLGRGEGGPWHARLGPALPPPPQLLRDELATAALRGGPRRARLLLAHGAEVNGLGGHPAYGGRTPRELALLNGHVEVAEILAAAGGSAALDETEQFVAACMRADAAAATGFGPDPLARPGADHGPAGCPGSPASPPVGPDQVVGAGRYPRRVADHAKADGGATTTSDPEDPRTFSGGAGSPVPEGTDALEPHRIALTGYCYRMLGSPFEAEDAVQETLVRAWRSLDRFDGSRAPLRSWLHAIATNVCLDMLRGARRRARVVDMGPSARPGPDLGAPLPESAFVQPVPDGRVLPTGGDPAELAAQRDTIRLAFVAALQHLPPRQRAVLILRDVLCWKADEVARLLDTTVASVTSALQRARTTMRTVSAASAGPGEPYRPMDPAQRRLLARYCDTFERYDVEAMVALLHEDAVTSMPPFLWWMRGRAAIRRMLLAAGHPCAGARLVPVTANGSPAFAQYRPTGPDGELEPFALVVLTLSGDLIAEMTTYLDAGRLFPLFGLPAVLEAGEGVAKDLPGER